MIYEYTRLTDSTNKRNLTRMSSKDMLQYIFQNRVLFNYNEDFLHVCVKCVTSTGRMSGKCVNVICKAFETIHVYCSGNVHIDCMYISVYITRIVCLNHIKCDLFLLKLL